MCVCDMTHAYAHLTSIRKQAISCIQCISRRTSGSDNLLFPGPFFPVFLLSDLLSELSDLLSEFPDSQRNSVFLEIVSFFWFWVFLCGLSESPDVHPRKTDLFLGVCVCLSSAMAAEGVCMCEYV